MLLERRSDESVFLYQPSHELPIIFAALVGVSCCLHIYQNFLYKSWRMTFWMAWAGAIFTTGWVIRAINTYNTTNTKLYIAQTICIYAGPPIYSAAEYNVLGRLMYYLPMHAPLNPGHITIFFIYISTAVESLAAAGAAYYATNRTADISIYIKGGTLLSASLLLQAAIEIVFISLVALMHHRAVKAKMLTPNVRMLCIMLYGTSTFVLIRCVARGVESFGTETVTTCGALCRILLFHEWYLYVFEAAPMVIYTWWINTIHPGRLLPRNKLCFLDLDGTERVGPGWIDKRARWSRFTDLLDVRGMVGGQRTRDAFWLRPDEWPPAHEDTASKNTPAMGRGDSVREVRSRPDGHVLADMRSEGD